MKIKSIIVDDESSGRKILNELVNKFCDDVEVVAVCSDLEEAVEHIKKLSPNLVFLDVEMPNYAGYEIVDFFDEINFKIIFVTAYDQYALKAFEASAIDYLLKPIEIEKLQLAVEKAKKMILVDDYKNELDKLSQSIRLSDKKLSIFYNNSHLNILVRDIVAIEASHAYTRIYMADEQIFLISKNLRQLEKELSDFENIYRAHRSWIINLDMVKSYFKTKQEILLTNGIIAKISKQNKQYFEKITGFV